MNEWVVVIVMMLTFLLAGMLLVAIGFCIWFVTQKLKTRLVGEPPAIRRV